MFDFLILKPKIFIRNGAQVMVTSPLQVPMIELCYGSACQPSLPLKVATDFEFLTDSFESHGDPHSFSQFVEI
jgi:hypothetical protein